MSRHEMSGTAPTLTAGSLMPGYHSVAGQPAQALQGTTLVAPLTLVDYIDARVREIDAERHRLSMLREQLVSSGVVIGVDDVRRVIG